MNTLASVGIDPSIMREYPSNIDAEKSILGAFILDPTLIDNYLDSLKEDDFFFNATRTLFNTIKKIHGNGVFVDIITLEDELKKNNTFDDIGGTRFLILLQENITIIAHVERYIEIIKEKSFLRSIIHNASHLIASCYAQDNDGIATIVDRAEKMFFDISCKKNSGGFLQLEIWLKKSFENLAASHAEFEGITGITSGFHLIDEMTNGFQKGDLIIVAARPSMGKTAFALCAARNAAIRGIEVGFVSLEMGADQLVMRILSFDSQVKLFSLRAGNLTSDEWIKITNSASRLSSMKIFIDDAPSQTIMEIRTKARKLKKEKGIKLLIIDYLQLLSSPKKYENRHYEVSEISRSLKSLAKELNIPIIALSQLSRGVESRVDKRPMLSDLRDSGAIEQDADLILFLYRDSVYNKENENTADAEVIIAKQRNGPTGTISLKYIKEYTLFEDNFNN